MLEKHPVTKSFVRLGATIAVGAGVVTAMIQLGPQAPGDYKGVEALAPATPWESAPASAGSVQVTVTNTPPPGVPSRRRPPPIIEVGDDELQPIDTKFGLRYTVPADWLNGAEGIAGWTGDAGEQTTYGSIAEYKYGFCSAQDSAKRGITGMTGRNGVDIATAANQMVRQAEFIFADSDNPNAVITYSDPVNFEIDGEPAVRITANVIGLTINNECDPPEASFDIVTTTGFSNATVAVFMMALDQGVDGALSDSTAEQIIASIEKSPQE